MKLLISVVVALVALLAAAYVASPSLLAWWVPMYLESQGVDRSHFVFGRPGRDHWSIGRAQLTIGAIEIEVTQIDLRYRIGELLDGRLQAIDVDVLEVRIEPSDDPLVIEVPPLWALVPADHLAVRSIVVDNRVPEARITGEFALDPAQARADLQIESSLLPAPLDARLMLEPEGGLELALGQRDAEYRALQVLGTPDHAGSITFDGTVDIDGDTFALLAGLAGFDGARGHVRGRVQGACPWPLGETVDWPAIRAAGEFDLNLQGVAAPFAEGDSAIGQISVDLQGGIATVATQNFRLGAAALQWEGERYTLGADSGFVLTAKLALPWPLGGPSDDDVDWNAVRAEGSMQIALIDALPFARGDSIAANLTFALADGRAALAAPSFTAKAGAVTMDGALYEFEDTSTLSLSGEASMPWPLPEVDMLSRVAVTARAGVAAAMTSESATAMASWANASAGIDLVLANGVATATLEEGASVELGTPAVSELALEARAPVVVDWRPANDVIEAKGVALTLRAPEVSVLDQRLALRGARIDIERLRLAGSELALRSKLQTRAAAQALPVQVAAAMNIETLSGTFEVGSEGKLTRPLLKTELPGWRSDYDVDRGDLAVTFKGAFRQRGDSLQIEGMGRIALIDGIAHYTDTVLDRVNVDLPIRLAPAGFAAGPSVVRIGAVDPGVPVTDVEFGVEIGSDVARLSAVGARLLGGKATVDRIDYHLVDANAEFAVHLEALQLQDVLALEGEDIVGDGVLDGRLPIRIDGAELIVSAGRIEARPPGGRLSYRGSLAAPAPGLDLAITALRNFQYGVLTADVDYAANGVLTLAVKLQGKSPDVEKGRPINFNLNVTEDIPALLESLRASESITDRVQQRFSR